MKNIRLRHTLSVLPWLALALFCQAQQVVRPNPSDPAHPFNTPAPVKEPAGDAKLESWRRQALAALSIPATPIAVNAHSFGSFAPMPGVVAHRVTYASQYGMRVTAIVYAPDHVRGKVPAVIVVAGHGGSKSTWYETYAGLLYARAGAVVVTYDPVGEEERNSMHLADGRAHDTVLPGLGSPARLGGVMIGDVMNAVSYAASLPEVDPKRIAVLGYSMGSFHAAVAAGLDPRIRALVLSGGGDLDGNGGSWDSSSKIMCQSGPYRALGFLPDKGAILYALHQRSGETLVLNGEEDNLVAVPHHGSAFFNDLNTRVAAFAGPNTPKIEYRFYPGVGHRPSWVNLDAATWLNQRLHFPHWQTVSPESFGTTHISTWAAETGAHINLGYTTEKTEGGIEAVGRGFPGLKQSQLQAVPDVEWKAHEEQYTWQGLAKQILLSEGLDPVPPQPAPPRAGVSPPSTAGRTPSIK